MRNEPGPQLPYEAPDEDKPLLPPWQKKRYWISWIQRTEDPRPIHFPPHESILGWWVSGYDQDGWPTICAAVEASDPGLASSALIHEWPELKEVIRSGEGWRFFEHDKGDAWIPGDRFPLSDWMKPRFGVEVS